jgi:hypothetical protein
MCGNLEIGCQIKEGFVAVGTTILDQLNAQANEAAVQTLNSATFWLYPKTAPVATEHGGTWASSGAVGFLQHNLVGLTATVFALAIIVAGMRMAWEQRARPLQELLKTILTFVVVAAAGTATIQLLVDWADGFASWLMTSTVETIRHTGQGGAAEVARQAGEASAAAAKDAQENFSLASSFGAPTGADGKAHQLFPATVPVLLALSMSIAVMLSGLVQMGLMLVRTAMLVLLSGAFPLAAAATNTELGKTWFRKFCGWSLAFIAYKPAAALIYATAIRLTNSDLLDGGDAIMQAMTGMMMLLMAIFALPALLRFMVPVTVAVAGGSAGMGSAAADPGGAATGAINVGSSFAGRGSGGGGAGGFGGGASGGASGGAAGGGASGARAVGAAGAGAALGAAGIGLAAARKAAGAVSGAVSHSGGEAGGGSITPSSATGSRAGRGPMNRPRATASRAGSTASGSSPPPPPPPFTSAPLGSAPLGSGPAGSGPAGSGPGGSGVAGMGPVGAGWSELGPTGS